MNKPTTISTIDEDDFEQTIHLLRRQNMKLIKSPEEYDVSDKFSIFLGGSIEMGTAENWQDRLTNDLSVYSDQLAILDPRRDDWDSSWVQDPTEGTDFYGQVMWERYAICDANLLVFYFDPGTKSPITLLELGEYGTARSFQTTVCCPPEFWRFGNVAIMCRENKIDLNVDYENMLESIKYSLTRHNVY